MRHGNLDSIRQAGYEPGSHLCIAISCLCGFSEKCIRQQNVGHRSIRSCIMLRATVAIWRQPSIYQKSIQFLLKHARLKAVGQDRVVKSGRKSGRKSGSRPISRVLSWATIHLGCASPLISSDLPGSSRGPQVQTRGSRTSLFGLAPGGVYLAVACCHRRGALLPHPFTLTCRRIADIGGLLSVALSVGSRPPGVTWHLTLWSPDFPPRLLAAIAWPTPGTSIRPRRLWRGAGQDDGFARASA